MRAAMIAMIFCILSSAGARTATAIMWADSVVNFTGYPNADFPQGIDQNGDGFSENGVDLFSPNGGSPTLALGAPDASYFSINPDQFVVFGFSNPISNVDGDDLFIVETGPAGESIRVSVSADGSDFDSHIIGTVTHTLIEGGLNSTPFGDYLGLDLGSVQGVRYVRFDMADIGNGSGLAGFDVTGVGAVPEPSTIAMLGAGLAALSRLRRHTSSR